MRVLATCALLASFCWTWELPQAQSARHELGHQTASQLPQERDLSVNAEIVKQSYCHADSESFAVQLQIKLRFTNVSDHPVILAKRVESPPIVRAAKTVQDAENGQFEYDSNPDYFPSKLPSSPRFGDSPGAEYFVTLAPQQSYETTVVSGVFGAVDPAKAHKGSGFLPKGNHVLQLGVGTWPYQWPYFTSTTSVNQLSDRWSKYGHLAHEAVYSNIVLFTIPDSFENPPCRSGQ